MYLIEKLTDHEYSLAVFSENGQVDLMRSSSIRSRDSR